MPTYKPADMFVDINVAPPRMKALAAANANFAVNNAAKAVNAGQGVEFNGKSNQVITARDAQGNPTASRDATAGERAGGINLSISIAGSSSTSTTAQTSDAGRGSTVAASTSRRAEPARTATCSSVAAT